MAQTAPAKRLKMSKLEKRNMLVAYSFLAPNFIGFIVFTLIPVIFSVALSFLNWSGGSTITWAGLDNFAYIFKDFSFNKSNLGIALKNTVLYTLATVPLTIACSLGLALVLNNKFRGRKIARAIVVFPWATTLVIQASVWNFIINKDYGTLNTLLMKIGLISQPVNWTPTPEAYFAWEIACGIFVTIPFVTFCVLSGLQSIDTSYYEAATVDGATYWQKLFKITLPLVKSSLTVSTVLNIIYVFNSFPIIWTMTKGDPANHTDTLVTYLYKLAFYNGKQGEAAAVSVIGFIILLVCASTYMVYTLRKGDDN